MRKSLLVGLLGIVLAAAAMIPLTKSSATQASQQKNGRSSQSKTRGSRSLPNYDIRLAGESEFTDHDLRSENAAAKGAAQNVALRTRASSVEAFRSRLNPEDGGKLRAIANHTGAMKSFFVEGATLSAPQAGAPDDIARGFLKQNNSLFALPDEAVAGLKLNRADNDHRARMSGMCSCGAFGPTRTRR
jgi:hypothetical protein